MRALSLSKELVETTEDFIEENPQASYKSIADFVADAVRTRFEQLGVYPEKISLLDINANELGPLLYDRNLKKTVQISITTDGFECAECKTSSCRHIKYALTNPKTQKLIRERKKRGLEASRRLRDAQSPLSFRVLCLQSHNSFVVILLKRATEKERIELLFGFRCSDS